MITTNLPPDTEPTVDADRQMTLAWRTALEGFGVSGWGVPTGTYSRAGFATYSAPAAASSYNQMQAQAAFNAIQQLSQALAALITDVRSDG